MSLNVALLERVKALIQHHPAMLQMEVWHCGTTACIAGWAVRLKSFSDPGFYVSSFIEPTKIKACRILGITAEESKSLFMVANWPTKLRSEYSEAIEDYEFSCTITKRQFLKRKAEVACKAIDAFIREHEVKPLELPFCPFPRKKEAH
jgi:hypothetical protein